MENFFAALGFFMVMLLSFLQFAVVIGFGYICLMAIASLFG